VGTVRNAYRSSVGKPEGKRPLARSRCGWESNATVKETECEGVDPVPVSQVTDQ
jgi:hypothetical protein